MESQFKVFITNPFIFSILMLLTGVVSSVSLIFILRFLDKIYFQNHEPAVSLKKPSILIAYAISWCFSFSLAVVFIFGMAHEEQDKEILDLSWMLKSVFVIMYPIGLGICTFAAFLVTPLAMRALRTGARNLIVFGSLFWLLLACYIFFSPSFSKNGFAILAGFVLSVMGLIIIAQIPPKMKG
jgi:hypothetical protein